MVGEAGTGTHLTHKQIEALLDALSEEGEK